MLVFREVTIGTGGIAGCVRCAGRKTAEPCSADEVGKALHRAASENDAPGPNVIFTGFEPFAHPALPQLVQAAVQAGFQRIRLRTDGGGLARSGNAEGVLGAGVRQVEIVLLAGEELHDSLTGRAGLFSAAEEGIAQLRRAAEAQGIEIAVTGLVPVCRHNAVGVAEAVAALAAWGAVAVTIDARERALDEHVLRAALDTGTLGLSAVSVLGQDVEAPYDRQPWEARQ